MRHFRALVESANGRFAHHDGDIEDGAQRLDRVLSQADVVLCPIDCVSHSAYLRAKKFCKRAAKTFVPLGAPACRRSRPGCTTPAAPWARPGREIPVRHVIE